LQFLDLIENQISISEMQALQNALPDCDISFGTQRKSE